MKKRFFYCLIALGLCLGAYTSAHAIGLGAYVTGSAGGATWMSNTGTDIDTNASFQYGAGLVLDTCVARQNVFNYRLNIGYNRYSTKHGLAGESGTLELDADGVVLVQSFGFGIVQTESMRFWLGPQLGLMYSRGSGTGRTSSAIFLISHNADYDMYGASLGLALGVNINIGQNLTLYVEGGARFSFNYVEVKDAGYTRAPNGAVFPDDSMSGALMVRGYEGYASLGVMFRINDSYSQQ